MTAMPTFVVFEKGQKRENVVRGADVRGLQSMVLGVVGEVGKLGEKEKTEVKTGNVEKKEEKVEKKEDEKEEGEKEEKTVSGSYGMTKGSGWRMKP